MARSDTSPRVFSAAVRPIGRRSGNAPADAVVQVQLRSQSMRLTPKEARDLGYALLGAADAGAKLLDPTLPTETPPPAAAD